MATLISLYQRKSFKNIDNLNIIINSKRFKRFYTNDYNTLLLSLSNKRNENFKKFLYKNFLSSINSNKKLSTKSQELIILPTKTQLTQSTQSTQSIQPTQSTQSTKSTQSTQSTQSTKSAQSTQSTQSTQSLNNEIQFLEEIPVKVQFPLLIKEIKTIKRQLPSIEEIKSNFDNYERMTNLIEELEYILKKESNKLDEIESKNFIIFL